MSRSLFVGKNLSSLFSWASNPVIVGAPMRVMSGPALAVAVSHAGGLGFIGPNAKTQDMLADLKEASSLINKDNVLQTAMAVSPSSSVLPVGVGFQLWADDIGTAIGVVQKYKPCAAWLYAPRHGQPDLDEWSRRIRNASPQTQIWIQIGTLAEVQGLIRSPVHPDVIVVQGEESGGHGRARDGLGLISLFPEVADELANAGSQIPLVAAGGIADGRTAAAAMCLGASGIAMGTRFLATTEARISNGYQQEVVRASNGAASTTRTQLYNHLRGTYGWPEEYSPRTIINRSFTEHQQGTEFAKLKELHDKAIQTGDSGWGPDGRLATYAGASIGLVHDVLDAGTIVTGIRKYLVGDIETA